SERIARVETIEASKHAERYLNAFHLGHASRALVPYDLAIGHVSGKTDATSIQLYHVLRERRALSILLQADLQAINNPDIQNDALNNLIVEAHEELFESASHLGELSLTNRIFSSANPGANDI